MQRRNTDQKNIIYQCIEGLGHATMEQVITSVNSRNPKISTSTIYRNIGVMISENKIKKFKINQVEVYETVKAKHYHFICNECGKIVDLIAEELDKKTSFPKLIEENLIEEVEIYFSGVCKNCLNKRSN